ncbi:unnamed protein product [Darwinula stevensoni]|uniref:CHK kinase-like domain-containing protein n=1 Tax=Darwinula stevensoni TaxID=69355 RepID=A0A7R9A691_9CRUS|nr:unnamed protein product [Darwinula stevensoni]CAG0888419.1 unnamed protein product [Darwinula stevensoni]
MEEKIVKEPWFLASLQQFLHLPFTPDVKEVRIQNVPEGKAFETEALFYFDFLNALHGQLSSMSQPWPPLAVPRLFHVQSGTLVILEDVHKNYGHSMIAFPQHIPQGHMKKLVEELARIHALSLLVLDESAASHFSLFLREPEPDEFRASETLIKDWSTFLRIRHPGMTDLAEALEKLGHKHPETLVVEIGKKPGRIHTLTHGDLWQNNLMWKDDGSVMILDWQEVSYRRPACDLATFLLTSCTSLERRELTDPLLDLYCEVFNDTTMKSGSTLDYPRREIERDYKECLLYALIRYLIAVPFVLASVPPTQGGNGGFLPGHHHNLMQEIIKGNIKDQVLEQRVLEVMCDLHDLHIL